MNLPLNEKWIKKRYKTLTTLVTIIECETTNVMYEIKSVKIQYPQGRVEKYSYERFLQDFEPYVENKKEFKPLIKKIRIME